MTTIKLIPILAVGLFGCRGTSPSSQPHTGTPLTVTGTLPATDLGGVATVALSTPSSATLQGRPFTFLLLSGSVAADTAGTGQIAVYTLQIDGDGLIMSISCFAPISYSISSNTINITSATDTTCNSALDITSTAGTYVINSHTFTLIANHAWGVRPDGSTSFLR